MSKVREGRTAFVAGSGRGIGRAIAERLAGKFIHGQVIRVDVRIALLPG